jgi:prepilin-type N-terminal cleavage/methylation domain-containing protein
MKSESLRRRISLGGSRPGWTLVEVMIAAVIMSISLLAFAGAMGGVIKSLHLSKRRTLATSLAQEKIEYMKNISY